MLAEEQDIINLKNIYKQEINSYTPHGFVDDKIFKQIIKHLKYYQENIKKDEFYDKIKDKI